MITRTDTLFSDTTPLRSEDTLCTARGAGARRRAADRRHRRLHHHLRLGRLQRLRAAEVHRHLAAPAETTSMLTIDDEAPGEAGAREVLLDRAFGPGRFAKTSERLREGRLPVLALSAREDATLIGTVRLWARSEEHTSELLLPGPLALAPAYPDPGAGRCATAAGGG